MADEIERARPVGWCEPPDEPIEIKITYETFVDDLTKFLNDRVGTDWQFDSEHDSGALFVKLNVGEDALDWGEEDEE